MAVALLAGLTLGVLLGAMQVGSADPSTSPWYLYPSSSFGVGTGFFANANHMGTLLIVSLPFLAALLAAARRSNVQRYSGLVAWVGGTGLVVLAGIALNQSLAAYGLVLPVLVASALILVPARTRWRGWIFGAALALLAAAVVGIAARPVASTWLDRQSSNSVESRAEMFRTTAAAARDFMPFGSGLGTFREVYHLYEKPADVTPTYVVHAHNDYLELALELGLPGVLLILAFLLWWGAAVWRVWRSAEAGPYARAASIASAAVLAHSLVDFPLRTAAISACMAMFVALLTARGAAPAARDPSDLRPTRHFVIN
jgi:O-antigen ligase